MFCFLQLHGSLRPALRPYVCVLARFSEAGERPKASQPTRPRSRAAGGRGRAVTTTREPVTVCRHNLGGRPACGLPRGRSNRQSRAAGAADGRAVDGPPGGGPASRVPSDARPAAQRSGRVSGIRPSDRRGPGPAGHRGRNVRSTGRCSYNLRITRRRADSCGLHRSTSQVIRRSGSGVFFLRRIISRGRRERPAARGLRRL